MVNAKEFTKRLELILGHHGLNATGFADAIGVPRSSISHILGGRNKPSLDFVMKLVQRFPEVNLYWLLNGKGEYPPAPEPEAYSAPQAGPVDRISGGPFAERIVIFYSDGTYREFKPNKS